MRKWEGCTFGEEIKENNKMVYIALKIKTLIQLSKIRIKKNKILYTKRKKRFCNYGWRFFNFRG